MSSIPRNLASGLPNAKELFGDRFSTALTEDEKLWFVSLKGVDQPSISYFHQTSLQGGHVINFDISTKTWSEPAPFPAISNEELLEDEIFGNGNHIFLLTYRRSGKFEFRDLYQWRSNQWQKMDKFKVDEKTTFDCGDRAPMNCVNSNNGETYFLAESGLNLIVSRLEIGDDGKSASIKLVNVITQMYPSSACNSHIVKAAISDQYVYAIYGQHGCGFHWNPTSPLQIDLRNGKVEQLEIGSDQEQTTRPPWAFSGAYKAYLVSPTRWLFFGGCRARGLSSVEDDRSIWELDLVRKHWKQFKVCDLPVGAVFVGVKNSVAYVVNVEEGVYEIDLK